MFNPSSPVTGAAQTGLTSPTYTIVVDTAPTPHGEQYAVSALGGTQTGVLPNSVSSPFTITAVKPATFRSLPLVNPVTGQLQNTPRNVYKLITRKGVVPLVGQNPVVMLVETVMHVPAGADLADPLSIEAALSLHAGTLWAQSAGIGDMLKDGVL